MKRQSTILLAAAVLALGASACFSDPVEDLQGDPTAIDLSRQTVTVRAGDSVAVIATVKDAQGNTLPVESVTWTSADPAVAAVTEDVVQPAPGAIFSRAFVRGVTNVPGITTVNLTVNGLQSTLRVTVLPATFPGTIAVTGTPSSDTVIINRPAPLPPLVNVYSAGDTVVLTAPANVTFNTNTVVTLGTIPANIIFNDGAVIRAVARTGYAGIVTVTNLTFAGNAETGTIAIATLNTSDSIAIARARFRGTAVVTNDPNFGANTLLTVTAPAGLTFDASTQIAIGGTPVIGTTAAVAPTSLTRLTQTATTMTAIAPSNRTGTILVTGAKVGTGRIDSLRVNGAANATTINVAALPGTVTNGAGTMMDTLVVNATAGVATFGTSGTTASNVVVGGQNAFIVSRTATQIKAVAVLPGAAVTVSNVTVGGVRIPSLPAVGVSVSSTSGELASREPDNDDMLTTVTLPVSATFDTVFGTLQAGVDGNDFYRIIIPAGTTGTIEAFLDFVGTGAGAAPNPDYDLYTVRDNNGNGAIGGPDICAEFGGSFTLVHCTGASAGQPEHEVTDPLPPGTYFLNVELFTSGGFTTPTTYRLRYRVTP